MSDIDWDFKGDLQDKNYRHGVEIEGIFYEGGSKEYEELFENKGLEPQYKDTLLGLMSEIYNNERK